MEAPARPLAGLHLDRLASPLGEILLVTDADGAVRALDFHDHVPRLLRLLRLQQGPVDLAEGAAPAGIRQALEAYFAGELAALTTLPLLSGGTAFQRQVWTALLDIPPGATASYAALAARLGRPTATRAVGAANGANPIAILVPCHRVVGARGALTGYGGGLWRKQWLLAHEGAN